MCTYNFIHYFLLGFSVSYLFVFAGLIDLNDKYSDAADVSAQKYVRVDLVSKCVKILIVEYFVNLTMFLMEHISVQCAQLMSPLHLLYSLISFPYRH